MSSAEDDVKGTHRRELRESYSERSTFCFDGRRAESGVWKENEVEWKWDEARNVEPTGDEGGRAAESPPAEDMADVACAVSDARANVSKGDFEKTSETTRRWPTDDEAV
jgi:hypothetical protein